MRLCLAMLIYSLLSVLVISDKGGKLESIVMLTKSPAKIIQNK